MESDFAESLRLQIQGALEFEDSRHHILGFLHRDTATLVCVAWRVARNQHTTKVKCNRGITDAGLTAVATHCPNITTIALRATQITDAGLTAVATHCPNITTINLSVTKITDAGLTAVATHCPNITDINLERTQITDAGLTAVATHCPNITTIDLCDSQITDAGLTAVATHCPKIVVNPSDLKHVVELL